MRMAVLPLLLVLANCSETEPLDTPENAAEALEDAAIQRGLVGDPDDRALTGMFTSEQARLCVVDGGAGAPSDPAGRVGLIIDRGAGAGCVASGSVMRRGDRLVMELGEQCSVEAEYDGTEIRFPATVPAGCGRLCSAGASIAGNSLWRLSASGSEAAAMRIPNGTRPCAEQRPSA